jgi:prepilin-type N-terminal cleavage/methylation domain-containing protein
MNHRAKRMAVFKKHSERGISLIELMIAMLVLSVGLGALTTLFVASIATDNRNSKDTSATLLAQKVIEELSAQSTNSTVAVTLTDCKGNTWVIPSTQGAAAPAGQGAPLATTAGSPYYGGIDFNQPIGAVPAGFGMRYVDCNQNGGQTTYDVRWNVMTVSANSTRLITASARQLTTTGNGGLYFAIPVTLRTVGGS